MKPIFKKAALYLIVTGLLVGLTVGGYFVFRKFLQDRQSAMNFKPPKRRVISQDGRKEVKRYTPEELKEAREKGELPPGMKVPAAAAPNHANDATQRSLRTIQEINKINEMNRRLMQQQQQIQNQR